MASLPSAIFFINGDITYPAAPPPTPDVFIGSEPNNPTSYIAEASELTTLQIQLFIDDTMTKAEFDARIAVDPNYSTVVHLQRLRILVILPTFQDEVNRKFADVVMFLHQGQADIEMNRFGWPLKSFNIQRLNMYELIRAAKCPGEITIPFDMCDQFCEKCNYPFYCDDCHTFSGIRTCGNCKCDCKCGCGIIDNQGIKRSPVHLPNCENEYHNRDFINRK